MENAIPVAQKAHGIEIRIGLYLNQKPRLYGTEERRSLVLKTDKYEVWFYHEIIDDVILFRSFGILIPRGEARRCTRVEIRQCNLPNPTIDGISVCNSVDNFNKAVGRKLALEDALKKIDSKEDRKEIWEEYRKSFK